MSLGRYATVRAFNKRHPVGTPVYYWPDHREGPRLAGHIGHPAIVLGGHTPCAWIHPHRAYVALTHIEPITDGGETP